MKRVNEWIIILVLVTLGFLLSGCGPSTQSGVHKTYDMRAEAREQSTINLTVVLDADTATDTISGDAPASLDLESRLTAAWDAAQSQSVDEGMAFLEDVRNWVDKRFEQDNSQDNSQGGGADPAPEPEPDDDVIEPEPDPDDGEFDPGDYDIAGEAACDQEMSFRDDTESTGIIQKKCVFDKPGPEYGKEFVVQWTSGNTLDVRDSSSMQWLIKNPDTGEKDYRKYHPAEPTGDGTMSYKPGTPAEVYAGRGDNSTRAVILVKKQ